MSSTKNVLHKWHAIVDGDMGVDVISPITNVQFLDNLLIQLNFVGIPSGTFSVQFSVDYEQDSQGAVTNEGNWIALPLAPTPRASGVADQIMIDLNQMPGPWMRVVFSSDGVVGSLNMYVSAKMV